MPDRLPIRRSIGLRPEGSGRGAAGVAAAATVYAEPLKWIGGGVSTYGIEVSGDGIEVPAHRLGPQSWVA